MSAALFAASALCAISVMVMPRLFRLLGWSRKA